MSWLSQVISDLLVYYKNLDSGLELDNLFSSKVKCNKIKYEVTLGKRKEI